MSMLLRSREVFIPKTRPLHTPDSAQLLSHTKMHLHLSSYSFQVYQHYILDMYK
jgi:hypothetical protein